jgi:K+-sensing histidine kinase KdpD
MKDVQNEIRTPLSPPRSHHRSIFKKVFGRWGLASVLAFTTLATVLRWITDSLLNDTAPYSFYYLSVVLTALVAPMGSSILAILIGGLCAHYLWVEPRFSFAFLSTSQVAQLIVYIMVATSCALAVAAARVLRFFDYVLTDDE